MKKNFCLLVFSVLVPLFVFAQPTPKIEPVGRGYPEDYTRTTYPTTDDESLNKVTKVEIKNGSGIVEVRLTYKKDITNKWTIVAEDVTPSGHCTCRRTFQFDQENKLISRERTTEGETTKHIRRHGVLVLESDPDSGDRIYKSTVKGIEECLEIDTKKIEENVSPSLGFLKSPCTEPGSNCQTQFAIFVGPSVLISDFGKSSETFFGGHASFVYNLSSRIGIGIDASIHSKKFGTENLSRRFALGIITYRLGNPANECSQKLRGNVHGLVGLGSEKYGSSNGSGWSFGIGGSVDKMLTERFGIMLQGDFLGIKFANSDELNANWRASIRAVFKMQRKHY